MLFELEMDFRRGRWKQSLGLGEETGMWAWGVGLNLFLVLTLCAGWGGLGRKGWGPAQTLSTDPTGIPEHGHT